MMMMMVATKEVSVEDIVACQAGFGSAEAFHIRLISLDTSLGFSMPSRWGFLLVSRRSHIASSHLSIAEIFIPLLAGVFFLVKRSYGRGGERAKKRGNDGGRRQEVG